jgi:ketosteroid isomerase-like protein
VSRANVESIKQMYDAYARGEYGLGLSYLDPEIEFSQPAEEPGAGTFHGHQGVIQAFAHWTREWDDYRVDAYELVDAGDQVLARTRHHGRGKTSGVEVEMLIFQLWTLRGGKVVRAKMYYDESEALEAAGFGKSDRSP